MLIRHLEFLVTLAEEGHFGRAADLCGVSQPALSLAIRKLEEDLGAPLILRGKRFMGLTAEGEKAVRWGQKILNDYGSLRDDLHNRRKGGLGGTLRLGVVAEAMALCPPLTARFEARNPLAAIAVTLLTAEEITARIVQGGLDGGLLRMPARRIAGVSVTPLGPVAPRFACRADHPLAPDESIAWDLAATQPLCVPTGAFTAQLAAHRIRPAVSCDTLDGVLAHLRTGLWCAVVPDSCAALLAPADDLVLRPMTGEPEQTLGLALPDRDPVGPMVQALADAARPAP